MNTDKAVGLFPEFHIRVQNASVVAHPSHPFFTSMVQEAGLCLVFCIEGLKCLSCGSHVSQIFKHIQLKWLVYTVPDLPLVHWIPYRISSA